MGSITYSPYGSSIGRLDCASIERMSIGGPAEESILFSGVVASVSILSLSSSVVVFATELPPNSPQRRENPATGAGPRSAVLGFPKRRGGIRTPRLRGTGRVCQVVQKLRQATK
jgi:hypothetical protein